MSSMARIVGTAAGAVLLLAAWLPLAGCSVSVAIGEEDGGGGGDGGASQAEALDATASALDTLMLLAGPGLGIADEPARLPAQETPPRALAASLLEWVEFAAPRRDGAVAVSGGRFVADQTVACDSGSVRILARFVNRVRFEPGDTVELSTQTCRRGSLRFSGSLTLRAVRMNGYPGISGTWDGRVGVDLSAWRTSTAALPLQSVAATGSVTLDARRDGPFEFALGLDSAQLALDPSSADRDRPRRTLESLQLDIDATAATQTVTADWQLVDAAFSDAALRRLRVQTMGALTQGRAPPAYPLGRLTVRFADDGVVYAEALDAARLRLEIDRNGNGSIDSTRSTSWGELRGRL
ncbi:MAG: hypothetical protein AB7L76_25440 [Burkholderiaceae bacterium]